MRRGSSVATSAPRPLRSGSRTRAASADHGVGGGGVVFTSEQIAAATRGQVLRRGGPGSITTDSRTARQGTWFLGLKGERYDGRMFASEAIARGCAGVVLEARDEEEAHKLRQSAEATGSDAGLVLVQGNSGGLDSLHGLARSVRDAFPGRVIGVTGSCGKTTTRSLASHLLRGLVSGGVHETEGNENNLVGVPRTLLGIRADTSHCVLELGMDRPGEIDTLQDLCSPDVRVVTNVGLAHLQGCGGTIEGVARAKAELVTTARPGDVCVLNADDPRVAAMRPPTGAETLLFGRGAGCDVRILASAPAGEDGLRSRVELDLGGGLGRVDAQVCQPGHRNVAENAAAACAVLVALGVDFDPALLSTGLSTFTSSLQDGRGRAREFWFEGKAVAVIDETYNSNPTSAMAALATLSDPAVGGGHAVLGDMLELGEASADQHAAVLRRCLQDRGIRSVHLVGSLFREALEAEGRAAGTKARWHDDPRAAAAAALAGCKDGDVVLVKGSRGLGMEAFFDESVGLIGGM